MISLALHGKDKDTRAEIAFTTITAKMQSSMSSKSWNYIVKNLVILNMCVDERVFLLDICNLNLKNVVKYKDDDEKISWSSIHISSNEH